MAEKFEDVLSRCIDRMALGEPVERCLEAHPEQREELRPLLQMASRMKEACALQPGTEFKARARREMQEALRRRREQARPQPAPLLHRFPRWATAVAAAMLIVLAAGGGTVAASSNSVPGDGLYAVKLGKENVQVALTFSEVGRARLQARFASVRAQEMAQLAAKNRVDVIEKLSARFDDHLARVEAAGVRGGRMSEAQREQVRQQLRYNAARDEAVLQGVEVKAPDHVKAAVAHAKMKLKAAYEEAISALDGQGAQS